MPTLRERLYELALVGAFVTASGSVLVRRVERLLGAPAPRPTPMQRRLFSLACAGGLALLGRSGPTVSSGELVREPESGPEVGADQGEHLALVELLRGLGYVEQREAEPEATLMIDEDGTIHTDGRALFVPSAADFTQLDAYLAERAESMDREWVNSNQPRGQRLASGEFALHAASGFPGESLMAVLERCAGPRIWRIRLNGEFPGGDLGPGMLVPRSFAHEGEQSPVDLWIGEDEVIAAGRQTDFDGERIDISIAVRNSGRKIDPGIVYRDVVEVLDVTLAAGLDSIGVVGAREQE